jgi:hypothetical protein
MQKILGYSKNSFPTKVAGVPAKSRLETKRADHEPHMSMLSRRHATQKH